MKYTKITMIERKNLTGKENSKNVFETIQIQHHKREKCLITYLQLSKPNDIVVFVPCFSSLKDIFPLALQTENSYLQM